MRTASLVAVVFTGTPLLDPWLFRFVDEQSVDKRHTLLQDNLVSVFDWNDDKNRQLEEERGVCFEDVLVCIANGGVLDVVRHTNRERYPNQLVMVINIADYVWLVPYVKSKGVRFMKTIIPSRKATRDYLS